MVSTKKVYYDKNGHLYAVIKNRWGLYTPHRARQDKTGWTPIPLTPPRETEAEAQIDLDEMSKKYGWKEQP